MKKAILSMDIEDWYHLDYFDKNECDKKYSMLDGLDVYADILTKNKIKSSFFVLGELSYSIKRTLLKLSNDEHDIGSHGWNHSKPLEMSIPSFTEDIKKSKSELENLLSKKVEGYRAPCFSLDRERLDIVQNEGYMYDSSRIEFSEHPLYGKIDLKGFETISKNIFKKDFFYEFQVSTQNVFGKNIPVSGGGYVRIFPWLFMKKLIGKYLDENELYVFYIHPFEFSEKENPSHLPSSMVNKCRFSLGRSSVENKFQNLLDLLKRNNFEFTTFSDLRSDLDKKQTNL